MRAVAIAVVIGLGLGCGAGKSNAPGTPVASVTPDLLVMAYSDNIAAADAKYTNKTVKLTGRVTSIPSHRLPGGGEYLVEFGEVLASFHPDDRDQVAKISVGGTHSVVGTCVAKAGKRPVILIANCDLVK